MSFETQLRDALSAEAGAIESTETQPYERVTAAVGRSRRRRRAVGISTAAAVAAIAIGVPLVARPWSDGTALPADRGASSEVAPGDPRWRTITTWPARGRLATDAALVASLEQTFTGRVIFAEDLDNTRFAVVVSGDQVIIVTGPRGSAPGGLAEALRSSASDYSDDVLTLASGKRFVVLTSPAVKEAEVSGIPTIGLDGTVARTWAALPLNDGVARGTFHQLTRVRVGTTAGGIQFVAGDGPDPQACADGCPDLDKAQRKLTLLSGDVAAMFELSLDDVTSTLRWQGAVPDAVGSPETSNATTLEVMDSTLPGGQVLRTVQVTSTGPASVETRILASARPMNVATADQTPLIARHMSNTVGSSTTVTVVVLDGASVRAVSSDESLWPSTQAVPLSNGIATFDIGASGNHVDQRYDLEVLDASGTVLTRTPMVQLQVDPYVSVD